MKCKPTPASLGGCLRSLIVLIVCCLPLLARAATISFDGGAVTGCTYASHQYTCAASAFSASNDVSIAHGYTVAGNIVAAQLDLGTDAHTSGNVTATNISLQPHASMSGNITASGTIALQPNSELSGNVNANTLTLQPNSDVNGNVTAVVVTLNGGATVSGSVACIDGEGVNCHCQDANGNPSSCPAPAPAFHHVLVSHPASGLTCTPTTVKITACANAACTAPHYTGAVSVTLNPGNLPFATGTDGTNSAATVSQTTAGNVTISASSSPAAPNAATCLNTSNNATNCVLAVADAGFLFDVPDHTADVQQNVYISAVRKSDNSPACVPAFSGTKSVSFCYNYVNPSSGGSSPSPVRVGIGGSNSDSAIAKCSAATTFSLNFDSSGTAPITVRYADVGQMSLSAAFVPGLPTEAGLLMSGQDNFIVAPDSFAFSIQGLAPPVVNASAPVFAKAGIAFPITLTALNKSGAVTQNFGNESTPETVTLTASQLLPAGGDVSTFYPNVFSSGVLNRNLTWNEVGIITVNAAIANPYGYLGTVSAQTNLRPSGSINIGRFTPAFFKTTMVDEPATTLPCPTGLTCPLAFNKFVYSRQTFQLKISAFNATGDPVTRYAGDFAKAVTLSAVDAVGGATANPPAATPGSSLSNVTAAASSFTAGEATVATSYAFAAAYPALTGLAAPTNVYLRASDTDGITSLRGTDSVEGGIMVVGGRFYVAHNYGSDLLPLPVSVTAQYWNGTRYVASTTDDVNTFPTSAVVFGQCLKGLNAGSGACSNVVAVSSAGIKIVTGTGIRSFKLNAPGGGLTGSAGVSINQPAWLPSSTGRLSFGIYSSPLIYLREVY